MADNDFYENQEDSYYSKDNLRQFRYEYKKFEQLEFCPETDALPESPPSRKCLIITCMDARVFPEAIFHLQYGEAHVVRNAGANGPAALHEIVVSQQKLGTKEIFLVKHHDCNMLDTSDEDEESNLAAAAGGVTTVATKARVLEAALRRDLDYLRDHPTVKKDTRMHGWIYCPRSGSIREVVTDPPAEHDDEPAGDDAEEDAGATPPLPQGPLSANRPNTGIRTPVSDGTSQTPAAAGGSPDGNRSPGRQTRSTAKPSPVASRSIVTTKGTGAVTKPAPKKKK